MAPVTDPAWLIRLRNVRGRCIDEPTDEELARHCPHVVLAQVRAVFSGELHPERQTLLEIVCALTDKPKERESVLSAYDRAEADLAAMKAPPPVFDPRSDTQILADAISGLAEAITELTKAIKPDQPDHH